MSAGRGPHRGVIWDDQHRVILVATGSSNFIGSVSLGMHVADPEPRTFTVKQKDGKTETYRIGLGSQPIKAQVGKPRSDDNGGWTQKRMYKEQLSRLVKERRFVQYRPEGGRQNSEHERALEDLRQLINQHGQEGAWLWDPFLSARDVLETLFHCVHSGADLRALTDAREVPTGPLTNLGGAAPASQCLSAQIYRRLTRLLHSSSLRPDFVLAQRAELDGTQSNWRGLRLEYRVRRGQAGWGFHDRFLIFPKSDSGALAWSLGTSVNSLGKEHHILQRVDDGQLVMDAFVDLWDSLAGSEHLIWKKP
jgi:hypothetical protein